MKKITSLPLQSTKMKIACLSDLHGHLPEVPDCDLLLLGGDYCPRSNSQEKWFVKKMTPWINELSKTRKIIGVAGNHDFIFEAGPDFRPQMEWTYLQDSGCEWGGYKFWGTPWQPAYYDWAFNANEWELMQIWKQIPDDTDILLLHGPPRGFGDLSPFGNVHTGSPSLLERIKEIKPKLVIAGHIHSGYGRYQIEETIFLNCSLVDEAYKPVNSIQIVELAS